MKKSFQFLFIAGTLSLFLLTNCRTSDDGTNNHGKATEGMFNEDPQGNANPNPSDATGGGSMSTRVTEDSSTQAPIDGVSSSD